MDILADGPFLPHQISVVYGGHGTPPPEIRDRIDDWWRESVDEAQRENRTLFNAPVAFLKACAVCGERLHLELAETDYKTFLVTTLRNRDWFEHHCPTAITPALGNSILLTFNNTAYLGLRSRAVAAYPGWAHLFGGVLDWPNNLAMGSEVLMTHLHRELHEELKLETDSLAAPPRLLGLFRDPFLGQPELVWHGMLKSPLEKLFADDIEHDDLLLVAWNQSDNRMALGAHLTPVSRASLTILQRMTDTQ